VVITSTGDPRVSFNLIDFCHNFLRLLGVERYGLTSRQVAEIADELRGGFETVFLKPPPIEFVPLEKALDHTAGCCRTVESEAGAHFDWRDAQKGNSDEGKSD
jgi:hypothetical protein